MASPKALILQGILGVAGLCASGAGGIGLGLGKAFGEVQSDAPAADIRDEPKINPQDTGEVVDDGDLGIPKECEGSCSLSAKQLKKLKFEKKGDEKIEFDGLEDTDEFELIIEVTEDQINYPKGNKYILKPKTIAGTVIIKNIKEGNIVLGKDQEVVIREVSAGGKLEHLLEEVDGLGIPKRCKADEVTGEAKTCELTKLQLQKLNLETRDSEKITVEGLGEGNLVTLKIEDKESDKDNYPRGKKYTLRSTTGPVTIKNVKEGDIVLGKDQEVLIRETEEGGKLEHLIEEVDRLGIPRRCKADEVTANTPQKCELIQRQLKDLKFEAKEGASITVDGQSDKSKFELTIEDKPNDGDNYPQGKKYTIKAKTGTATIRGVKEGDIDIWNGQSVVVRETSGGGKLERAPVEVDELGIPKDCKESCQLTPKQLKNLKFETKGDEEITVEFLNKAKTVELKVEDKENDTENYPHGKKYTLSAWNGQVKIKGLKDGDIEIGKEGAVVIREKKGVKKLEKAPEEINNLGIPRRCKADEVSAETRKCQLTKEQLQRINFEAKSGSSIKFNDLSESSSFELTFKTIFDDADNYPKGKKYTLRAKTGTVTIAGAKDKDIVLEENKEVVFREIKEGNKLETYLDILGIPRGCGAEEVIDGSDPKTCELTQDQLKELKFENFEGKNGDVKVEGLKGTEKITLKISWDGEKNNYPDNRKYSLANTSKTQDIKIIKEGEEVKITKQTESWFGNKDEKLSLAETKNKGQIEKEDKLAEVKKILKQLGLEGLSSNLEFEAYGNNRTKLKQAIVEFRDAEGLKKIQFKKLGGGAEGVTSLGIWSIKVYLNWAEDESKFPKNMKFSFESPSFDSGYNLWRGNNTITIYKKESKTNPDNRKNVFKIEKQGNQDKWYLVRTNN